MPARAVATRGSAMAAGGLGYARSVCRGSPVLCLSLDENLRLIRKPGLCGGPIGRVVARNRLLTADTQQSRPLSLSGVVEVPLGSIDRRCWRYRVRPMSRRRTLLRRLNRADYPGRGWRERHSTQVASLRSNDKPSHGLGAARRASDFFDLNPHSRIKQRL